MPLHVGRISLSLGIPCLLVAAAALWHFQTTSAQVTAPPPALPPINYLKSPPDDPIARLQKKIDAGTVSLPFDKRHGYLPAVLKALGIPESSQTLVFSKTSFQRKAIAPWRPRALYFNDDAYIGWVQSGEVLEVASVDKDLGTIFYTLNQEEADKPHFSRQTTNCLQCHEGSMTGNIPGLVIRSTFTEASGASMLNVPNYLTTSAAPFSERWGGWYVTGKTGTMRHMGNLIIHAGDSPRMADLSAGHDLMDLSTKFETSRYLSSGSDVVALLVLTHQAQVHNLIIKAAYQARGTQTDSKAASSALPGKVTQSPEASPQKFEEACEALLREMLFCGKTPLPSPIEGSSTFAHDFTAAGPKDKKGRSLRDLDLHTRLFKYPCSYLIYTESFAALPMQAKDFIYQRLFNILSGKDTSPEFAHLSPDDRGAIREILRETVKNLPSYWK